MKNNNSNNRVANRISPITAAALSKGVAGPVGEVNVQELIDASALESLAKSEKSRYGINKEILELFQDVTFCATTVANSIIGPNDGVTNGARFTMPDLQIDPSLKADALKMITNELENHYKFNSGMANKIEKAMFYQGAYCKIYIPEASFDSALRSNIGEGELVVENYLNRSYKNKGLLGTGDNVKMLQEAGLTIESSREVINLVQAEEPLSKLMGIDISDDISMLNDTAIEKALVDLEIKSMYSPDLTIENSKASLKVRDILRNPDTLVKEEILSINDYRSNARDSIGRPIDFEVFPFAIKPLWSVSPDNHAAYILLLDENGNPIVMETEMSTDDTENDYSLNKMKADAIAKVINKAKSNLAAMTEEAKDLKNNHQIFGAIIEQELKARINTGKLGSIVEVDDIKDLSRLMFARTMSGKRTKVLVLPANLVAYHAYDFKSNGTGRSKLERVSLLYSMRAILLYASLAANVKNSIPLSKVVVTIDDDEPNVEKAMKQAVSHVIRNKTAEIPIGEVGTRGLATWSNQLGLNFTFKNKKLPTTEIEIDNTSRNIITPDDSLTEKIEDLIYMSFNLAPDFVRNGMRDANFATIARTQSKYEATRLRGEQTTTEILNSKEAKIILRTDAVIRSKLKELILKHKKDVKKVAKNLNITEDDAGVAIIEAMIEALAVKLPKLEMTEGDKLVDKYRDKMDGVEAVLEDLFNRDIFDMTELGEEFSDKHESIKAILKAMAAKEFLADNNYLPELNNFMAGTNDDGDEVNYFRSFVNHMDAMNSAFIELYKSIKKSGAATDKSINKINEGAEEEPDVTEPPTDEDGGEEETNTGEELDNSGSEELDGGDEDLEGFPGIE